MKANTPADIAAVKFYQLFDASYADAENFYNLCRVADAIECSNPITYLRATGITLMVGRDAEGNIRTVNRYM